MLTPFAIKISIYCLLHIPDSDDCIDFLSEPHLFQSVQLMLIKQPLSQTQPGYVCFSFRDEASLVFLS